MRQLTVFGDILRSNSALLGRGSTLIQTTMPFLGLLGCGGPSGAGLEFGRCGDCLSRPSPVQARFAGLVVCPGSKDTFSLDSDSPFGG